MARLGALLALLLLPALYAGGTSGAALSNGDEAIYAQMAREMRASGDASELRWDGEPLFARPPASVWALAAAYTLLGERPVERPVRWLNALASAAVVSLTILLGATLFSPRVGLGAGGLLATADLFAGYARLYESEPILLLFVLGAFLAWSDPRARRGTLLVYGACLGGALLTKQLVGLVPLLAPIVDALVLRRGGATARRPLRDGLLGLAVGLAVAAPWHAIMLARHGAAFADAYFVQSLAGRATTSLLHRTAPDFYLRELVTSEGWIFAGLLLGSALGALLSGLHRAQAAPLLVGAWGIGVLCVYSLARSRYDYYLLLAYPGFALAAASFVPRLPLRAPLALALLGAVLVASAALHLPRNVGAARGDAEVRDLLAQARALHPSPLPVYTFNLHPYTARVYGEAPAHVFVESARDVEAARVLARTGMPAPALLAAPPAAAIDLARRPALLLWPRARLSALREAPADRLRLVGETPSLLLFHLP